ncbi:MAG: hypothetical protein AAB225_03790 [Acidobacteriota bacterium]
MYSLYGISLRSAWPLPLPRATGHLSPEIELCEGDGACFAEASDELARSPDGEQWYTHLALPSNTDYLRWSRLFEFTVSPDGRRIVGRPLERGSAEAFHTYLLSQVLSFALLKLGMEPLHSTSVVVEQGAIAFVGDCGYGKSTLAAAFLQAGYALLTDDLLVLRKQDGRYDAYPGPPRIKLLPEVARELLGTAASGSPMNDLTDKLIIPLNGCQHYGQPAPLRAFYVLQPPEESSRNGAVALRRLRASEAFVEITRNTFNTAVDDGPRLKRQFGFTTQLASEVPVKLLTYPRDLSLLPAVRDRILSDLRG